MRRASPFVATCGQTVGQMLDTLRAIGRIVATPIPAETRRKLAEDWARVPERYRGRRQTFGRHGTNCGATIGAMPRCDFACRGCYLGDDANRTPAATVDEVKRQMRLLRPVLGELGNLQL